MQRAMGSGAHVCFAFGSSLAGFFGELRTRKLLPDIINGHGRGVEHIVGIEAVVAELVELDLVGGEVGAAGFPGELIGSQQERGFRELILVQPVFDVADGRYGEDDLLALHLRQSHQFPIVLRDLFAGESAAGEAAGGHLVAVGYYAALHLVDPCRSPGDDDHVCFL